MKKRLGERVREELERSGKTSKTIALSTQEQMATTLGDSADKPETVIGKFSKLLNDKPEGLAYFFAPDHRVRLQALAHALGIDVETLEDWRKHDSMPTLVLDPRLPLDAIRFISAQADDRSAMYRAVVVEKPAPGQDVDTAIRTELAKHPDSIAVVATNETLRMFAFAGHSVTMVCAVPRGHALDAFPDLVPIPPPAPPRIFDDAGLPVLPIEAPTPRRAGHESFGRELDEIERRVFEPARQRGDVPCLSVKDAITWNTRDAGPLVPRSTGRYGERNAPVEVIPDRTFRLAQLLGDEKSSTAVWIDNKRIFAVGAHGPEVAALFAPHHIVEEPEDLAGLRARVTEDHPWQLLEDAEKPEDPLNPLLQDLRPWAEARQVRCVAALVPKQGETARLLRDNEDSPREHLRELATYGIEGGHATLLLALERAADAPLVTFEPLEGKGDPSLALLADLGGGHLLRVRAMRMPGRRTRLKQRSLASNHAAAELARELGIQYLRSTIYDGGDVLVSIEWGTEESLEGWSLPARRRRAEEARRRDDDYGDD
ncbi:MAG TPA: hypothetical protein VFQ53_04680 [Kofleriaceae bacterium]|nr:hypothetical protein [Kofleriaceae bacterium]